MGDVDDRDTEVFVNVFDFVLHLLAEVLVQRTQWLIHQHHLRVKHQGPRYRHALLLTTRQLGRQPVTERAQLYHIQCPFDALVDF